MRRHAGRAALLTALAIGVLAGFGASAAASTVRFLDLEGENPYPGVQYLARPGEANDVLFTFEPGERDVTVVDHGAVITAGEACVSLDEHTARCSAPDRPGWTPRLAWGRVALGDADDRLRTAGADDVGHGEMLVLAGPGDDTTHGGNANDRIDGGGGVDALHGGTTGTGTPTATATGQRSGRRRAPTCSTASRRRPLVPRRGRRHRLLRRRNGQPAPPRRRPARRTGLRALHPRRSGVVRRGPVAAVPGEDRGARPAVPDSVRERGSRRGGDPGFPCSARIGLWSRGSRKPLIATTPVRRFDTARSVTVRLNRRGVRLAGRENGVLATYDVRAKNLPDVRWTLRLKLRG